LAAPENHREERFNEAIHLRCKTSGFQTQADGEGERSIFTFSVCEDRGRRRDPRSITSFCKTEDARMLLPSLVCQRVVRRWIDGVLADLDGRTGPPSTKTMEEKLVRKSLFQRFKAQVSASTARSSKKKDALCGRTKTQMKARTRCDTRRRRCPLRLDGVL
jgi:hypothetical protein